MKDPQAFPSFSIRSFERSREFYQDILGLKIREIPMGESKILELELPDMRVLLYEKKDHTPATYTVLNFQVDDIDNVVTELAKKGVKFEHYQGTDGKGITRNGGPTIAWFKDPDGNYLSLIQNEESARTGYSGEAPPSPS